MPGFINKPEAMEGALGLTLGEELSESAPEIIILSRLMLSASSPVEIISVFSMKGRVIEMIKKYLQ